MMKNRQGDEPLISVIIPVYNAAYCIARCLDNLLSSDYNNFEVLVVDDASTDETTRLASRADCRIVRQTSNRGAAAARNRGSREARGKILFFLDADVFIQREALGLIVEDLVEKSSASAVIGVYAVSQESKGFYSQYQNLFTIFNHERSKGYIGWFWTAMGAVTREAFEAAGGFNEHYTGASAEDVELGYMMNRKGFKILYDNRIRGIHYHHHSLRSLLKNNFKKSAALVELTWKMARHDRSSHGFTDRRNFVALVAAALLTGSLILFLLDVRWGVLHIAAWAVFVSANLPFYRFLRTEKGALFVLRTIFLHYLIYLTVGLGSVLGTSRYYRNKISLQSG